LLALDPYGKKTISAEKKSDDAIFRLEANGTMVAFYAASEGLL
jgi:hypothetical protein